MASANRRLATLVTALIACATPPTAPTPHPAVPATAATTATETPPAASDDGDEGPLVAAPEVLAAFTPLHERCASGDAAACLRAALVGSRDEALETQAQDDLRRACDGRVAEACAQAAEIVDGAQRDALLTRACTLGALSPCVQVVLERYGAAETEGATSTQTTSLDGAVLLPLLERTGTAEAEATLAMLLLRDADTQPAISGVHRDDKRALALTRSACRRGVHDGCVIEIMYVAGGCDPSETLELCMAPYDAPEILQACRRGVDAACAIAAGQAARDGEAAALADLERRCATKRAHPYACQTLGDVQRDGATGRPPAPLAARRAYARACDLGALAACAEVGALDGPAGTPLLLTTCQRGGRQACDALTERCAHGADDACAAPHLRPHP